jgi:serine protease SohB
VAEFLADYGLFLVQVLTVAVVVVVLFGVLASVARRGVQVEGLTVRHLNRSLEETRQQMRRTMAGRSAWRRDRRAWRRKQRAARDGGGKARIFVLDFKGDLRATATASLRQEISAVLSVAEEGDQVLVRLENAGGAVHEHGFAASQLLRIRQRGLNLVVAVDKVAASGGYLMACVANQLMAAPFAIVGSIGVLAQLPNFHRWLEEKGIDFEQVTAGQHKRTLTVFGKNTEDARRKLREELEDVHTLFKQQVAEHRPQVDVERVSTGEHWYGLRALEMNLIDEVRTSDDFLLEAVDQHEVFLVRWHRHRNWTEKLFSGVEGMLSR